MLGLGRRHSREAGRLAGLVSDVRIVDAAPDEAVIDIEGVIGVPETVQFDHAGERVATWERFSSRVAALGALRCARITVNIRSTGGDVGHALLIYEALRGTGARITTRCWGYVASAATVIAQAADEGLREISADALYLIHGSQCSAEGTADQLGQTLGLLRETDRRIAAIYARRSGREVGEFEALMRENGGLGRWLSPAEAVAAGLADRILGERSGGEEASGVQPEEGRPGAAGMEAGEAPPTEGEARTGAGSETPQVETSQVEAPWAGANGGGTSGCGTNGGGANGCGANGGGVNGAGANGCGTSGGGVNGAGTNGGGAAEPSARAEGVSVRGMAACELEHRARLIGMLAGRAAGAAGWRHRCEELEGRVRDLGDRLETARSENGSLQARCASLESDGRASDEQVARLSARIEQLEAECALLRVGPTLVMPCEDPSPSAAEPRSANAEAYARDAGRLLRG